MGEVWLLDHFVTPQKLLPCAPLPSICHPRKRLLPGLPSAGHGSRGLWVGPFNTGPVHPSPAASVWPLEKLDIFAPLNLQVGTIPCSWSLLSLLSTQAAPAGLLTLDIFRGELVPSLYFLAMWVTGQVFKISDSSSTVVSGQWCLGFGRWRQVGLGLPQPPPLAEESKMTCLPSIISVSI